jgi:hypothetical protein
LIHRRFYLHAYQTAFEYLWLPGFAFIALGIILMYLELKGALAAAFLCLGVILLAYSLIKHQLIKPLRDKSDALEKETNERIKIEGKAKQFEQQLHTVTDQALQGITIIKQGK